MMLSCPFGVVGSPVMKSMLMLDQVSFGTGKLNNSPWGLCVGFLFLWQVGQALT